jgi:hypothetical protein
MDRKFAFLILALFSAGFAFANEQVETSDEPIEIVKQQWRQNAHSWIEKADSLEKKIKGISGKEVTNEIIGEMLILTAYTNFIRPDTEGIVMKQVGNLLICHLIFHADGGLVDIAYIYNENGKLETVRFDSIPVGVFVSMSSNDKTGRFIFVNFSKSNAMIVIDRLDPFAAVSMDAK